MVHFIMENMGTMLILGSIILFNGCSCSSPERLKARIGLLTDRLDSEILARREETQLMKDKLKDIQETLTNKPDNDEEMKSEIFEEKDGFEKYENLASVVRRGFADEKRFNERFRRNVVDLEAKVNDLVKEQLGMVKNISSEVLSLREKNEESSGKWDICHAEMQNLTEQIGHIPEEVGTFFEPWKSELQNLEKRMLEKINSVDDRIESVSEKVDVVLNLINFEFKKFKSCQELLENDINENGMYDIYPKGRATNVRVFCDQVTDGGGWTVIQRRQDGSVDFYRGWDDYKQGFGDLEGEFWLGNEYIYKLTSSGKHELRIDMEDFSSERRYAKYKSFQIGPESEKFTLFVEGYTGNAGNSFGRHNSSAFSTKDRDNDVHSKHCSEAYKGGWWYHDGCHTANLNGLYLHGKNELRGQGINWGDWYDYNYSIKFVEMKIR